MVFPIKAFNAINDLQKEFEAAVEEVKSEIDDGKWAGVKFSKAVKFFLELEWKKKAISNEDLKSFHLKSIGTAVNL